MHPLRRSRLLLDRHPRPPFLRGPDRPRGKSAAAVRAHIAKLALDAVRTESALVTADARLRRIGRKVLVAIFAVWPELERHDRRALTKEKDHRKSDAPFERRISLDSGRVSPVMPGFVPGIRVLGGHAKIGDMDGRDVGERKRRRPSDGYARP